ncbi:MAG TPA: hypothetical protein DD477_11135 [Spirochaetaceae bacterium]|nr:hypothetical protein [Spirochaetaceae bacterium]HAW85243.1 hypothetical protein [Spirochaetaceae bacterium]HAX38345.1 hypothetical protein [Spirochaetaceae bacterium]HBO41751.1 hypothetical protein [Spirochaetaceae bacterium]HCQ86202.1 hypothetical protein [Spirochaetaceae bacterium]
MAPVDIRRPGLNCAEVTETLFENEPSSTVFVITGFTADPLAVRSLAAGAIGLLRKPFEVAKVIDFFQDKPYCLSQAIPGRAESYRGRRGFVGGYRPVWRVIRLPQVDQGFG